MGTWSFPRCAGDRPQTTAGGRERPTVPPQPDATTHQAAGRAGGAAFPAPRPTARTGRRAAGAPRRARLLACCAVVLAVPACAGQQAASLPATAPPLTAPAARTASAPAASAAQAVSAAYTAYFPASKAAEAGPPGRAEATLAPYAAQPYLGQVLSQMAVYRARGQTAWGQVIPHVTKITVHARLATVYDCQDASHAALASTSTGTVIPGTAGAARTSLIASLSLGRDGHWRLTSLAHVDVPCTGSPSSS